MLQLQHGDVLFQKVRTLPKEATRKPDTGRLVIAEGEATGHHHVIESGKATLWELKGELYLKADAPVTITHEEHKAIPIPPGIYHIGQVREHDYFADMERTVAD